MLSKSEIIFILLLFYSRIDQVSSFHKIIQMSLCISHPHCGHHSGSRSLYFYPSSWWFHFYKSQVLSLWRIISYFYLLLHSVIPSYTSYHLQKTSIPLSSYQIWTQRPSHWFSSPTVSRFLFANFLLLFFSYSSFITSAISSMSELCYQNQKSPSSSHFFTVTLPKFHHFTR